MKHRTLTLKAFSGIFTLALLVLSSCAGETKKSEEMIDGHEAVDLGLSVKWAKKNIGAMASISDGDFYEWGDTNKKRRSVDKGKTFIVSEILDIQGNREYDAATQNWGSSWRMPTKREFEELINRCTWTWKDEAGEHGFTVTGPNGNSIFLPAAGIAGSGLVHHQGASAVYWSGTSHDSKCYGEADLLIAKDNGEITMDTGTRYYGCSIRPVTKK